MRSTAARLGVAHPALWLARPVPHHSRGNCRSRRVISPDVIECVFVPDADTCPPEREIEHVYRAVSVQWFHDTSEPWQGRTESNPLDASFGGSPVTMTSALKGTATGRPTTQSQSST